MLQRENQNDYSAFQHQKTIYNVPSIVFGLFDWPLMKILDVVTQVQQCVAVVNMGGEKRIAISFTRGANVSYNFTLKPRKHLSTTVLRQVQRRTCLAR